MNVIRSLIYVIVTALFTGIWGVICILCCVFPYKTRRALAIVWCKFCINFAKMMCGIDYEIIGLENLPNKPSVLLCKHQSAWETFFLFYALNVPVAYVLKKELLRIPFFGWALALYYMIPIDRSHGVRALRQVIAEGKDRLKKGLNIIIFPEGTRTQSGNTLKYQVSGTRLAIENEVDAVPIALNSGECWTRNPFNMQSGKITVSIGPSISSHGKTPDGMMQEVETWIETEMKRISPQAYQNKTYAEQNHS